MKSKSLILIVIACGCGLVASIGISQVMDRGGGAKTETTQILVTLTDIGINDTLDAKNVKLEDWPKDRVPEGTFSKLEEVKDLFPRARMYKGEPLLKAKLSGTKGDNKTIPIGFRVVPISVERGVVTDLIQPGDKVDILVYMPKGGDVPMATTKTVLTQVPIFAVNDKTERAKDDKNETIQARTVSVLVKPDQVESLTLAMQLGKITLSLRSPGDKTSPVLGGSHTSGLLSSGPPSDAAAPPPVVPIIPVDTPKVDALPVQIAAVPQGPVKKMVVHTPEGAKLYTWNGDSDVPEVITLGEAGSAAPAIVPVSVPAANNERKCKPVSHFNRRRPGRTLARVVRGCRVGGRGRDRRLPAQSAQLAYISVHY